ncbi:MAG: hypothetical protein EYC70_07305 [Planctomycetota bacterium]|nr:MAG: hypothetical protein EYC70_07305 [Planctomycetota bacterium]
MLSALLCVVAGMQAPGPADWHELRVLYAGRPDSARAGAFLEFLRGHFHSVSSVGLRKLSAVPAADYDVAIADWEVEEDFEELPAIALSEDFAKPLVLLGSVAPSLAQRAKFEYL